jgi:predicted DNA binding CopG/RHH family protein
MATKKRKYYRGNRPLVKDRPVRLRMGDSMYRRIEAEARKKGTSVSEMIRVIVHEHYSGNERDRRS